MEEIVKIAVGFFTDETRVVLFLFSCVFYRQWHIAVKKLEEMHKNYIDLIKAQTKSNVDLSKSLTGINHTISLLAERIK